jgi:hypothetical protein
VKFNGCESQKFTFLANDFGHEYIGLYSICMSVTSFCGLVKLSKQKNSLLQKYGCKVGNTLWKYGCALYGSHIWRTDTLGGSAVESQF